MVTADEATATEEEAVVEEESGCGPICESKAMTNSMVVAMLALCIVCGESEF